MAEETNTNWSQSVAGVVRRGDDVLLVRHTYGSGKGKLIIPGGYVHYGESPQEAVIRELREETSVEAVPQKLIGVRFNQKDWYIIFQMEYISGTPASDGDENSEAVFRNIYEMMDSAECPDLTRVLLRSVAEGQDSGLIQTPFQGNPNSGVASLYTLSPKSEAATEPKENAEV